MGYGVSGSAVALIRRMAWWCAAMGTAAFVAYSVSRDSTADAVFGDEDVRRIILEADRVDAFRLDPRGGGSGADPLIVSGPTPVEPQLARDLSQLVGSRSTYADVQKGCAPWFDVRLRFTRGPESVEVDFSLKCAMLFVHRDGERCGAMGEFDPGGVELIAAMHRVFPDDPDVQAVQRPAP